MTRTSVKAPLISFGHAEHTRADVKENAYVKRKNERIEGYKPIQACDDQQLYMRIMGNRNV